MNSLRALARRFGFDIRRLPRPDTAEYVRLYGGESVAQRRFYNLGAGAFRHPCWTNVDLQTGDAPHALAWDMMSRQPLPVADAVAELVYTSHTVEHVPDEDAARLFGEVRRILKPGGLFRVVTPDIDLSHRAWRNGVKEFFNWIRRHEGTDYWKDTNLRIPLTQASLSQVFLEDFASTASTVVVEGAEKRIDDDELRRVFDELPYEEALDHCTRRCPRELQRRFPFHHMNWFNAGKLTRMLREAGFSGVRRSAYLQSDAPVLRNPAYFDQSIPNVSLYAEARG